MSVTATIGDTDALFFEDPLGNSITVQYLLVTPDVAKQWLATNIENNRPINGSNLDKIKMDLREDRFVFNGSTIAFDYMDRLVDGQHRLRGIVQTGISAWVLVVRGLDAAAFPTLGQDQHRSVNDILHMTERPIKNASHVIAATQIIILSDKELRAVSQNRGRVADLVWEYYDQIGPWTTWAKTTTRMAVGFNISQTHASGRQRRDKSAVSVSPLVALCFIMEGQGARTELIRQFWEAILTGAVVDQSLYDPALAMRRYLTETQPLIREGGTQLPYLLRTYDTIIRSYNKWRLGQTLKVVKPSGGGEGIRWARDLTVAVAV